MYSKDEEKQIKTEFWTKLGNELEKKKNSHGSKVSWLSYNTGFNDLYFRMEADRTSVKLCIDIQFKNPGIRNLFFEQFEEFKDKLEKLFKDTLKWDKEFEHSNGKTIARLTIEKEDVNLYERKDWDKMHLFLKLNFVKLDKFWCEFGEVFKNLK